ncbi:MAG: hypothetical protein B6244_00735 [Candidatus Cloacimonetes bacterium 4572_55]|nr:MAG: hypothetical protein B6244_00735 [Candidatus Cloacimonetes bacterium 4572_55]
MRYFFLLTAGASFLYICHCLRSNSSKRPSEDAGEIIHYENFSSEYIAHRHIDVWLPLDYLENENKRFPVIYMHDGQGLFDPKTPHTGATWGVNEAMTRLIKERSVVPAIVVGIWNTRKRSPEYMPKKAIDMIKDPVLKKKWVTKMWKSYIESGETADQNGNELKKEPLSDHYLKFLTTELKPFIDSNYRTVLQPDHTFIMGSSMGGLISLYAVCEYPDIFGGAGCLSTHWPPGNGIMIDYAKENVPDPQTHKIYFDYGTKGLDAEYEPYQVRMDSIMTAAGYIKGKNWITKKFKGAGHSKRAWRKRIHIPLQFFLGTDTHSKKNQKK